MLNKTQVKGTYADNSISKQIIKLPLEQIVVETTFNIRDEIDYDKTNPNLNSLALDLIDNGLLQPVTVIKNHEGQYKLYIGFMRYHAHKLIQEASELIIGNERHPITDNDKQRFINIDCIVVDEPDETERIIRQLSENDNRNSISNVEKSDLVKKLLSDGRNQTELANKLGKSKGHISDYKAIAEKLNPEIRKLIKQVENYGYTQSKYQDLFLGVKSNETDEDKEIASVFDPAEQRIVGVKKLRAIARSKQQVYSFCKTFKDKYYPADYSHIEIDDKEKERINDLFKDSDDTPVDPVLEAWKEYNKSNRVINKNEEDKKQKLDSIAKLIEALTEKKKEVKSLKIEEAKPVKPKEKPEVIKAKKDPKEKKTKEASPKKKSKKSAKVKAEDEI